VYASSTSALATGSALTYDGTSLGVGSIAASQTLIRPYTGGSYGAIYSGAVTPSGSNFVFAYNATETDINAGTFTAHLIGGSEQMRLTSTGLGIGTSSPNGTLTINKPNTTNGTVFLNGATSTPDFMRIKNTGGDAVWGVESSTGGSILVGSSAYASVLYTVGSTSLQFGTNSSVKATLDSSGNLGLGVTPSAWSTSYRKAMQLFTGGSIVGGDGPTFVGVNANVYLNSSAIYTYIATGQSTRYEQQSGIHYWFNAPSGTAGNPVTFTQAMTLDNSGNLLVGTTTAFSPLTINGSNRFDTATFGDITTPANNCGIYLRSTGAAGISWASGGYLAFFGSGVGSGERARISAAGGFSVGTTADPGAGAIYATGNITAYYSSDAKFKENIQDVPDALGIVTAIGSKTFEWTDEYLKDHGGEDEYFQPKQSFGVIAQDVQKVFPQAVRTRTDGSLAVDYEKLAILSFGAIGQLLKRVEALEAK
jgi:hypothetical protein